MIETLNFFSEFRSYVKETVAIAVTAIFESDEILVVPQSTGAFLDGIGLFRNRTDKGYSLTDCISMNVMRELNIADVLTHDDHFTQEGFNTLL